MALLQRQFGLDDAYLETSRQNSLSPNALQWMSTDRSCMDGGYNVDHAAQAVSATPPDTLLRLERTWREWWDTPVWGTASGACAPPTEGRLTYRTLMQLCGLDQALWRQYETSCSSSGSPAMSTDRAWSGGMSVGRRAAPLPTMGASDRLETPPVEIPALVQPMI